MRKSFLACSVLLAAGPALATDITLADLPAQLRECSGPGCHLSLHSAVDIGSMSAFAMFSGGQQSWVLRYTVSPGSSDSVGEHLWLQMQAHYDLTEELHPVTLYMNEVDAGWRWSDAGQAPQFSMTTDALLASSASGEVQFLGPPPAETCGQAGPRLRRHPAFLPARRSTCCISISPTMAEVPTSNSMQPRRAPCCSASSTAGSTRACCSRRPRRTSLHRCRCPQRGCCSRVRRRCSVQCVAASRRSRAPRRHLTETTVGQCCIRASDRQNFANYVLPANPARG